MRLVSNSGRIRLHSAQIFLSNALRREHVGLEELDDGIWSIYFYDTLLGRFDERKRRPTT